MKNSGMLGGALYADFTVCSVYRTIRSGTGASLPVFPSGLSVRGAEAGLVDGIK